MRLFGLICFLMLACSGSHSALGAADSNKAESNKEPSNRLSAFFTDGCSNWIDGTIQQPYLWRHCCVAHDKAYWLGGTAEERKATDETLLSCMKTESNKAMAGYMYFMVRWGGHPDWLTWYRWGYGWQYLENGAPRGYKIPTEEEQKQINLLLPDAENKIAADELKHPRALKRF